MKFKNLSYLAGIIVVFSSSVLAQSNNNGVQINTDVFGDNIIHDAANEPSFAISPVDTNIIVAGWRQFDTITSDVRYAGNAYSWDGGKTWTNNPVLEPPPGAGMYANQSDPVLAANNDGDFFYNSLIFNSLRDGMTVYRSVNGGEFWETPFYQVEGFEDKNWYTVDRSGGVGYQNHYGIWWGIQFTRSTDNGQTWSRVIDIGNGTMSYVAVGPTGELYASWRDGYVVAVRRSDDAQDPNVNPTFGPEVTLPFGSTPRGLRVNPGGAAGQVYVEPDWSGGNRYGWVYALASSTNTDPADVMFARSTDGGMTFSDPKRVNDDFDPNGNDLQWMAAMSVSPAGRIDAVWFDTRDDPNHFLSRLYYTFSYDGGITWDRNRPISDPFDSTIGYPVQQKIGDYYQCLSDNGGVGIVYPATFNGEEDIYFKRVHPIEFEADPLIAGKTTEFRVRGAKPNRQTIMVYSTTGEGRQYVPALNVNVELDSPQLAGQPKKTNQFGQVSWTLPIPVKSSGRDVWMQVMQKENASNVIAITIQ